MADMMDEKYGKIGGTSIETPLNCKQLISLNYPGVVKNPSMMIETLGGESKLTKAFNDDHAPSHSTSSLVTLTVSQLEAWPAGLHPYS
ncbi:uncharacterized protein LOC115929205 [Strongylocentrotus purpuratus]|uniref:Transcription factor IIIC subunit Tfc1/Sfc1 triple barrel domain-containing protein n=1 Tax=Strongylocentrotus purpuratus TaxID=7668 RepID=A0A7M7PNZ7_STRPU|nr:uncharacterized protein LOC115929205 [Strongylocentrotus purpuratus]